MTGADDRESLKPIWQRRFEFYDRYGPPATSLEARTALRALPFGTRMRITSNILAFLFGPIYFFVQGMWRKGLILLLIAVAIGAALCAVNIFGRALPASACLAGYQMALANYAYYLHRVKHSRSWNPFEGFGPRRKRRPA